MLREHGVREVHVYKIEEKGNHRVSSLAEVCRPLIGLSVLEVSRWRLPADLALDHKMFLTVRKSLYVVKHVFLIHSLA